MVSAGAQSAQLSNKMRVTRTDEIVAVGEHSETVTKVTTLMRRLSWLTLLLTCSALAQLNPQIPGANAEMPSGFTTSIKQSPAMSRGTQEVGKPGPAGVLYDQLRDVGLDSHRVYSIRGASLDHDTLHISLDDGTIAFTRDVLGKITGAFFEGEGEVLLTPPDQGERISVSLFTGAAILEEKFTSAYLRFNDDLAAQLSPTLRLEDGDQAFATR